MTEKKRALALGFFDGMHGAHQAVVRAACAYADTHDMIPTAVTFDHHPQSAISGEKERLINTKESRIALFHALGIKDVIILPFDDVRDTPWDVFVKEMLVEKLRAGFVSTGYDFRFGQGGKGTAEILCSILSEYGIECETIARMQLDGVEYASSTIRNYIADGKMEEAAKFLGYPHYIEGEVIHGKALGRTIGSPTMNVAFAPEVVIPKNGVYCTYVVIDGIRYPAVTNVAGGDNPLAEAFVLDFDRNVYGKQVRIEFLHFVREMVSFSSLEELKTQISKDTESARRYFEERTQKNWKSIAD